MNELLAYCSSDADGEVHAVNLCEQPVIDIRCSDTSRAVSAVPVLLDFLPKASLAALAASSSVDQCIHMQRG